MKIKLDRSYNFLVPYSMPMIRLGNYGDGGYVVPQCILKANTLVSLGLGHNWSFDKHWTSIRPSTVVHAYDGTIDSIDFNVDLKKDYDSFFKGDVTHFKENATIDNIDSIINRVQGSVFFKIDIEGHEYDLVPYISKTKNLLGMVIEFHNLDFSHRLDQFISLITDLNNNFRITHIHANNYGGLNKDNLPHTLEISFVRKDLCVTNEKRYDTYIQLLDSPNALNSEEYMLCFDLDN